MQLGSRHRVRLDRRVVALLLATSLAFLVAAPALATASTRHDAALTKATIHRSSSTARDARVAPLVPALLAAVAGMGVAFTLASRRVPRTSLARRRITDVGDDWRALLLGAPPASS